MASVAPKRARPIASSAMVSGLVRDGASIGTGGRVGGGPATHGPSGGGGAGGGGSSDEVIDPGEIEELVPEVVGVGG